MKNVAYLIFVIGMALIVTAMTIYPSHSNRNNSLKTVKIFNETDMDIKKLYFSPEGEESWKELKIDAVKFNDEREISVKIGIEENCNFDFKAVSAEEKFHIFESFDLCEEKEIYFYIEENIEEPDSSNVDSVKRVFN